MKRALLHTIFWSLFGVFIFYSQLPFYKSVSTTIFVLLQVTLIAHTLLIFYLNYLVITPKFMIQKRRLGLFLFLCLTLVILGMSLSSAIFNFFGWLSEVQLNPLKSGERVVSSFFTALMFVVFSSVTRLLRQYNEDRLKRAELRQIARDAELAAMKAQLNPHFLYNSFNTIYALAESKSDLTSKAVLQLSEIMRYVTYSSGQTKVPLSEELTFIKNYIEFQKLRVSEPEKKVITNIMDPKESLEISPLLFIPLVENAFKYCNLISQTAQIKIDFGPFGEGFRLLVSNEIMKHKNGKSGIGLITLKKMLELSYPDRHKLKIWTENDTHYAELYLNLSSNA